MLLWKQQTSSGFTKRCVRYQTFVGLKHRGKVIARHYCMRAEGCMDRTTVAPTNTLPTERTTAYAFCAPTFQFMVSAYETSTFVKVGHDEYTDKLQ